MSYLARATLAALLLSAAGAACATDLGNLFSVGKDLAKAASLSDQDIMDGSRQMMEQLDQQAPLAPASSKYARRLAKLTAGLENEDGLKLNFAVYESPEVNAFATPDGSIRIYSGLMDLMTDDELRGVIGHEIGHAKLGHAKAQMKKALLLSAGTKLAGASSSAAGRAVAANAKTIEAFGKAQFSQADETASDDYGFAFMKKRQYDVNAMSTAFGKLAKMERAGGNDLMASHPDPASRARRMAEKAGQP